MDTYTHMKTWDEVVHRIFENKDFHDVVFTTEFCNESVSFPAHKFILVTSSPMFAEMFCEPNTKDTNHITLRNVQPKVLELMLSHIYLKKEVKFESLQQCFDVLTLATNFELSNLRRICTNYIEGFLDVTHVCSIYEMSRSVRNLNLAMKSFQFIQKNTSNILKEASWTNVLPVTVETIVKQEYLNIDSEKQLFEAVAYWAKNRLETQGIHKDKNLRQEIEPYLQYFRFLAMDKTTVIDVDATTKVFQDNELASIVSYGVRDNTRELPAWVNRSTNCRTYEYQATVNDTYRDNWFNINTKTYLHSELVQKFSSVFKAKYQDFSIHQLSIAICDDCFAQNRRSKRNIKIKVTIRVDTVEQETTIILPMNHYVKYQRTPNFDEKEPLFLARSWSQNFSSHSGVDTGAHSPVIKAFQDWDCPRLIEVSNFYPSTLSNVINFKSPIFVQSQERFELSIETSNQHEAFFCCKKKPSFENAPFVSHTGAGRKIEDESFEVWCAFASLGYSVCKKENILCE